MTEDVEHLASEYHRILSSFSLGMLRLFQARLTTSTITIALHVLHTTEGAVPLETPFSDVLKRMLDIPFTHFDAFRYVTRISHLVYATTLLDTFLSDTTKFLLLLFPGAIGRDQQVPLATILDTSDKKSIIELAASKRAREISYLSFSARVAFLRQAFGLQIDISEQAGIALEHYSTIRNTLVHDQGIFAVTLGPDDKPSVDQKTCPSHPTPIKTEDVWLATDSYCAIVIGVSQAILAQIFKMTRHPMYDEAFQALLPRAPTQPLDEDPL